MNHHVSISHYTPLKLWVMHVVNTSTILRLYIIPAVRTVAVNAGKKRGYEWTCCGRTTAKQHATVNLHTRTG